MKQSISSCKGYLLLFFLLSVFYSQSFLHAQTANEKPPFIQFSYIKTLPGKHDIYLELLNNYSKKLMQSSLKQGKIFGWYVHEVLMPQGEQAEYDVLVVNVAPDFKPMLDDTTNSRNLFKEILPGYSDMQVDSVMGLYGNLRKIVKREIFIGVAKLVMDAQPPSKYLTIDFMKPLPGKTNSYIKMEQEVFMPLHKERVKLGVLNDWALINKVLPYDSRSEYDFVTINFFDDLNSLEDSKYPEAIKKVFPSRTGAQIDQMIMANRKLIHTDILKLVNYADRSAETR